MPEIAVDPAEVVSVVPVAAAAAAAADPGAVAAALAAGCAALGGLSSAEALAAVAAVWVPAVRRLAGEWQAFAVLAGTAADSYRRTEAQVGRAAA